VGAVRRPIERVHVVPDPEAVHAHGVDAPIGLSDLLDGAVLRVDLVADFEAWRQPENLR